MHDAFGNPEGSSLRVRALDEDGELIAPEAGDHVAFGGAHHALAEDGEELISDSVAERVVEVFEAIDIEEHHRHAIGTGGRAQCPREPGEEERAVGEAGERIVEGAIDEGIGGFLDRVGQAIEGAIHGFDFAQRTRRGARIELTFGGGRECGGNGAEGAGDAAMQDVSSSCGCGPSRQQGHRKRVWSLAQEVQQRDRQQARGEHDRTEVDGDREPWYQVTARGHPPAFRGWMAHVRGWTDANHRYRVYRRTFTNKTGCCA